ncbi:MAG: hypothetical protein ACRC28_02710 [Clostridium sp.]
MGTINVNVGVPNSYIVLYDHTLNTSTQALTNGAGSYSFTSIPIGSYSIYNTAIDTTGQNPPTTCGFPPGGYTGTTYPRRIDTTIVTATTTRTITFDFDKPVPWSAAYGGNPPPYGLTTGGGVNLATGATVAIPAIVNNGMGYSIKDDMIYGQCAQKRTDGTGADITLHPVVNLVNGSNLNVGDCDFRGLLIFPEALGAVNTMCAICIDPLNLLYLRPVDIFAPDVELTVSPYGTVFSPSLSSTADQAFVPSINSIIWVASGEVKRFSLDTIAATTMTITGVPLTNSGGVCFSDMKNFYCPTGSKIYKLKLTDTIAEGSYLANSTLGTVGDASRAANMPVFAVNPIITKKVDKAFASPGDTLIYTTTIVNTGLTDGIIDTFIDTIPTGTQFITDTINLDGVLQTGKTPLNLDLGSLLIGVIRTVTFNVLVTSTIANSELTNVASLETTYYDGATEQNYTFDYISNNAVTTVVAPFIDINKTRDRTYGKIGDIITYTIVATNSSTLTATKSIMLDTTPVGSTFVSNSLIVNGVTITGGNLNPPTGYSLGTITGGKVNTVTFKVQVVSVPSNNTIENMAKLTYVYNVTGTTTVPLTSYSNTVTTDIKEANFTNIKKMVDKLYTIPGDTLTYTIVVPNTGNVSGTNVILKDTIPNGTTFVTNSMQINGASSTEVPPNINLGTILAGEVKTIIYQVLVN